MILWTRNRKRRSWFKRPLLLAAISILLISTATGCNYTRKFQDSDYDYGSQQKNDPKMIGSRMYGPLSNLPDQHENKHFEYSSMLSREVSSVNGVGGAIVMLTDKNAYVGIVLDWTAVGTKRSGGPGMHEQINTGTTEGVYNYLNGSPYYDNKKAVTPFNSYFSVSDLNQISGELKQTIAVRVRGLSPHVQEVHISANQHFMNELVSYAREAWLGRPLASWKDDFNILVNYEFGNGKVEPVKLHELKKERAIKPQGESGQQK